MQKIPLKNRIITSVFASISVIGGLTLWNYLRDKPHNFPVYLIIAIGIGVLDFFIYKYKG